MKFLKQEENKHFYYSGKGNLFCTNSENCIAYIKDESEIKDSAKLEKAGTVYYDSSSGTYYVVKEDGTKTSLK